MITLSTTAVTQTKRRNLTDVQVIYRPDNTIQIRGTIGISVHDGTSIIKQRVLATIELSGADLDAALAAAVLPTATVVRDKFRNLFHTAWTNRIGVINQQGTESDP